MQVCPLQVKWLFVRRAGRSRYWVVSQCAAPNSQVTSWAAYLQEGDATLPKGTNTSEAVAATMPQVGRAVSVQAMGLSSRSPCPFPERPGWVGARIIRCSALAHHVTTVAARQTGRAGRRATRDVTLLTADRRRRDRLRRPCVFTMIP